jgi:hypothetical protein
MTTVQELGITAVATGGADVRVHLPDTLPFTANWLGAVCQQLAAEATDPPYFCCKATGASVVFSTALDQNTSVATALLDLELPALSTEKLDKPEFLLITERREAIIEPAMALSAQWLRDWIAEVDVRGATAADWRLQIREGYLSLEGRSLNMSLLGCAPYRPRYQRCSDVVIVVHFDRYGRTGTGSIRARWSNPLACTPNLLDMPHAVRNVQLLGYGEACAEVVGPELSISDPTRMVAALQPLAVEFLKRLGCHPEPAADLKIVLKDQPVFGLPHNSGQETTIVRRFGVLSDRT